MIISNAFFKQNTIDVAKNLLGKKLCVKRDGVVCCGIISETEAYRGFEDDACHGSRGVTERNKIIFKDAGHIYVYLNYGIHYLINFVTEQKDLPSAVLIRAVIASDNLDVIATRRYGTKYLDLTQIQKINLCNGPGKLTKALGIDKSFNDNKIADDQIEIDSAQNSIWIEDVDYKVRPIHASKRIGVDYAVNAKDWNWNFKI